ncbi:phosphoglycerate dehydrogenase, partial [Rothia kristinae]
VAAEVGARGGGRRAGAASDVATPAPRPAEAPLWGAPPLIITPPAAGGRPVGAEELIGHNLKVLRGDGEFRNRM